MLYLAGSVTIPVGDVDRAARFCHDTLGLPIRFEAGAAWAEVAALGLTMRLALTDTDPAVRPARGRRRLTISLEVGDRDAAGAELRRRGIRVRTQGDVRRGRRRAAFRDPDGTRRTLREPPAGAAGVTLAREGGRLVLANDSLSVRYDLDAGTIDLTWQTGAIVRHAYAAARLRTADGTQDLRSTDVTNRHYAHEPVDGPFGPGLLLRVQGVHPELAVTLNQTIAVFEATPFALLRVAVERPPGAGPLITTDQIEVLAAGGVIDPPGWVSIGEAPGPWF